MDGAPGTVAGITELLAEDEVLPALVYAVTVNVYDVPLVNPDTVSGLLSPLAVSDPGVEVTT